MTEVKAPVIGMSSQLALVGITMMQYSYRRATSHSLAKRAHALHQPVMAPPSLSDHTVSVTYSILVTSQGQGLNPRVCTQDRAAHRRAASTAAPSAQAPGTSHS